MATAGVIQKLHQSLLGDITLLLSADLSVIGLQTLEQDGLVHSHTGSSEDRGVLGHPDEEDETLANGGASSLLVDSHHSENTIENLVLIELLHHLSDSLLSIAEDLERLVLSQLEENPVERRVLLLELLPERLEGHFVLLDLGNVVSLELDILSSNVEDVLVRGVSSARTTQLLDDLLLGHLLQGVDLKANVSSAKELANTGTNGTDLGTVENGGSQTDPGNEHVFNTSACNSRFVLDCNDLDESKLALYSHPSP